MSERVLHEWSEWGQTVQVVGESIRTTNDSDDWHEQHDVMVAHELARLAARVAELEGENAKLYSALLDLYNAHQDKKLNGVMRASGRWTQIKGLVGEASDREYRASRAEVDKP